MSFHIFGLYPVGFLQTEFICTVTEVALLANLRAGNAAGSFVQWPKDLVTLGQDPISLEKKKSHKMTPKGKVQDSEKVESKGNKRYILAPYIQDDHWMLLLFCLHESAIYVFDPLKKDRTIRLKTPARMAFKLYVSQGGQRNNRKEFLWHHTEVKCPQQGDMDSGFFVMRYMYDIVMLSQKNPNMNLKVGLGSRSYTRKEINEVTLSSALSFEVLTVQACKFLPAAVL
ncbi:hypothetical protein ACET3Z_028132 [Daucus carota]